eukprot:CAMPEP_0194536064 /NCGR_PEP_ID=MMETSP0253-20130528/74853_1 /TAXON_ID=2966 /ORGANISM="Noctiluca scintillans" /LENGTH=834 /DNA_ID=CAMNT_0039381939 /DNA_START=151 /DNA_END=2655 /DNA_ORIENTATION=-
MRSFEPVLVSCTERWLSPLGGPPRCPRPLVVDAITLSAEPALAVEAADHEVALVSRRRVSPTERRRPKAFGHALRVPIPVAPRPRGRLQPLPAKLSAPKDRPLSQASVTEAIYLRDVLGKSAGVWRSELDSEVLGHDADVAAWASHRIRSLRAAQRRGRQQAAMWRERTERSRGLCELRWKLQREAHRLAQPAPVEATPCSIVVAGAEEAHAHHSLSPSVNKSKLRVCKTVTPENSEADGDRQSTSDGSNESEEDRNCAGSNLKASTLKPKQPLRLRVKRLQQNARDRRRLQKDEKTFTPRSSEGSRRLRTSMVRPTLKDRNAYQQKFEKYDADHSGHLDSTELRLCLCDLGLRGRSESERHAIKEILDSFEGETVDLELFVSDVVPAVRLALAELQEIRLRETFIEGDSDGSGMLSIDEAVRVLRLMGIFPSEAIVMEVICDVVPDAIEVSKTISGEWLIDRDILDLEKFVALIALLRERTEREYLESFQALALTYLPGEEHDMWRHNLVELDEEFRRTGCDHVNYAQAMVILRNAGQLPRDTGVLPTIFAEHATDGAVSFGALLQVISTLRKLDDHRLENLFEVCGQETGSLTFVEAHRAMHQAGATGSEEIGEVEELLDEFSDGSGRLVDTKGFALFCRFIGDRLHKVRVERARQLAASHGWSDAFFDELKTAFSVVDLDSSGTLGPEKLVKVCEVMHLTYSNHDINSALVTLGWNSDPLGSVSVNRVMLVKLLVLLDQWDAERKFSTAMQEMVGLAVPDMIAKLLLILQHLDSHGFRSSTLVELRRELDGLVHVRASMEVMNDVMSRIRAEVATHSKSGSRSPRDQQGVT